MSTIQEMHDIAKRFFDDLEAKDLVDMPDLFNVLDDYARQKDFMICAEQKGIYGTRIYFGRVSTYEG